MWRADVEQRSDCDIERCLDYDIGSRVQIGGFRLLSLHKDMLAHRQV